MPMTCGPNLTASRLRRICGDCCMRKFRVDPEWGIPEGTPPLILDGTTGLVRPASSFETLAGLWAMGANSFVGFSSEWFAPGEDHLVWVYTCGWVEMSIGDVNGGAGTAVVSPGDEYMIGFDDDDTPSNVYAIPWASIPNATTTFWAVEGCYCQNDWVHRVRCVEDPPDANNTSPTRSASDQVTQRTVILQFGRCCHPNSWTTPAP